MKRLILALVTGVFLVVSFSGCSKRKQESSEDFESLEADLDIPPTSPVVTPSAPSLPVNPLRSSLAMVDSINVYRNPDKPEQLLVEIKGSLPNGCTQLGAIDYKVIGNSFKYSIPVVDTSNGGYCTQATVPFSRKMGLNSSTRPLAPGSYVVDVNGNLQPFNV